jgi:hypothetical protein
MPTPLEADIARDCPIVPITGYLFHGTETSGLIEILEAQEIHAYQHDEICIPGFCTSTDDRVLMAFSSQQGSGLEFHMEESSPLLGIALSDFYHAILNCETTSDFWNELVAHDPKAQDRAEALGLFDPLGNLLTSGESILASHPAHQEAHALCFPDWERPYQGPRIGWCLNEHEVCILQNGCRPLWENLQHVLWEKEQLTLEEAFEKLTFTKNKENPTNNREDLAKSLSFS